MRSIVLSVAACCAATGGPTCGVGAAVVPLVNDTDMPVSNWSAVAINTTGGFSVAVGNPAAGGNDGAYRRITQTSTRSPAQGTVIHTHATGWTPSTQGAISMLDMMVDVNCFNGGTSNAVGFGLVVVQGGVVFFGPTFTALTASGWRTDLRRTNLVAADFNASGVGAPDFAATGGTISFGFFSSNGTASGAPINSLSGADNFVVTLNAVPAPGAAGMLALGGVVAARRRRS